MILGIVDPDGGEYEPGGTGSTNLRLEQLNSM